ALTEALNVLEASPFDPLLDPFRVMVDRQQWYASEVRSSRHQRRQRAPRRPSLTLGARLAAEWARLVCVHGEANAWPVRHPERRDPELVHFVAWRPATGERHETVLAPRAPLAPFTTAHLELSTAQLDAGDSIAAWLQSWRAFARPDDVLVHWGSFQ